MDSMMVHLARRELLMVFSVLTVVSMTQIIFGSAEALDNDPPSPDLRDPDIRIELCPYVDY